MATTILELAVTVYSGRHFPRLPVGHTVRIQATVDSQVRETIPSQIRTKSGSGKIATLGPQPVWQDGGRLAWHITKETLNKYKSTNPTIKLYVYSSGAAGTGAVSDTMSLGYIVIDLRSPNIYAAASDIKKKWLKLKGKGAHGDVLLSCKISAKEALQLVQKNSTSKFDESVDVSLRINLKQSKGGDLSLRTVINLPNGSGKKNKVAVLCETDKIVEAKKAGADVVGSDDLIEKIASGKFDFTKLVCTPAMMGKIGKHGKVLGPKGLMPNPKLGTVATDVEKAVKDIKTGLVEIRNDKDGNLASTIGRKSFSTEKLLENYNFFIESVKKEKPDTIKGELIKSTFLTSTMGISYKIGA